MNKRHYLQIYHQSETQPINKSSELYSVHQAAQVLGVSGSTAWRWIEAGKLPALRVGQTAIRIRANDLEAIVTPAREETKEGVRKMAREQVPVERAAQDELARHKALVARILAKREKRKIAPLTTADLVRQAREQASPGNGG